MWRGETSQWGRHRGNPANNREITMSDFPIFAQMMSQQNQKPQTKLEPGSAFTDPCKNRIGFLGETFWMQQFPLVAKSNEDPN